jgi:hypothetical protein
MGLCARVGYRIPPGYRVVDFFEERNGRKSTILQTLAGHFLNPTRVQRPILNFNPRGKL